MRRLALCFVTATVAMASHHQPQTYSKHAIVAAERCCGVEERACCTETIEFNRALDCGLPEAQRLEAALCVQEAIYGESSVRFLSVRELACCATFHDDDNDPNGECAKVCRTTLNSPSLSSKQKNLRIRHCKRENPLFDCFDSCRLRSREWRQAGNASPFVYAETACSARGKMRDGVHYVGEPLEHA